MEDSSKETFAKQGTSDVEMTGVEVSRRVRKIFHLIQNKVITWFHVGFFVDERGPGEGGGGGNMWICGQIHMFCCILLIFVTHSKKTNSL